MPERECNRIYENPVSPASVVYLESFSCGHLPAHVATLDFYRVYRPTAEGALLVSK